MGPRKRTRWGQINLTQSGFLSAVVCLRHGQRGRKFVRNGTDKVIGSGQCTLRPQPAPQWGVDQAASPYLKPHWNDDDTQALPLRPRQTSPSSSFHARAAPWFWKDFVMRKAYDTLKTRSTVLVVAGKQGSESRPPTCCVRPEWLTLGSKERPSSCCMSLPNALCRAGAAACR